MNIFQNMFAERNFVLNANALCGYSLKEAIQRKPKELSELPSSVRNGIYAISILLMSEIYSPQILRTAHQCWPLLPSYVKKGLHAEIRMLMNRVDQFSNQELEKRIRAHTITRTIKIMHHYKRCPIPITADKEIPVTYANLLSKKGEKNLQTLMHAICHGDFSEDMYHLALECGHKFLINLDNYTSWPVDFDHANQLASFHYFDEKGQRKPIIQFPVIQTMQGCVNGCSHCEVSAQKHLSYMPYVMFLQLHKEYDKYYKYFEKYAKCHNPFDRFYMDSDPLSYYDPIMHVDGGDIVWKLASENKPFFVQTKGITGDVSRRALAKIALETDTQKHIYLSFVDTPFEDMARNISQLHKSLHLIKELPVHKKVMIDHLMTLKGPSVQEEIFKGNHTRKLNIYANGRAKTLLGKIVKQSPNPNTQIACSIKPNGRIMQTKLLDGICHHSQIGHLTFPKSTYTKQRS